MTKLMFDIAKMTGKAEKMGVLNPLIRQGLGSGQFFTLVRCTPADENQRSLKLLCSWFPVSVPMNLSWQGLTVSEDSSYINGQAIVVDGGLTSGAPYTRAKM